MLRSAASPGSVGFGRCGGGASGLLMTPFPPGHLIAHAFPADIFLAWAAFKARPPRPRARPMSQPYAKEPAEDAERDRYPDAQGDWKPIPFGKSASRSDWYGRC